jgi:hypothetical protein
METVEIPRQFFNHPAFGRNRIFRLGAYLWLATNSPVTASLREIAREWRKPKTVTARIIEIMLIRLTHTGTRC